MALGFINLEASSSYNIFSFGDFRLVLVFDKVDGFSTAALE